MVSPDELDPRFRVVCLTRTPRPQQIVYAAMHQDYSQKPVALESWPDEEKAGEVIVRRLLAGDRGHYGCYSADTEVLTSSGWMPWPNVTTDTSLLAVDIATKNCHFEKPSALQVVPLDPLDKLYTLESQYLNFAVTMDHRMVISHRQKSGQFSDWYFAEASQVVGKPVRYLLNGCLVASERQMPDDMPSDIDPLLSLKLAGFFFGDGLRTKNICPKSIRFRLRRPRKVAYLLSLGLPTASREGDRYVIESPKLAAWIHRHFSSDKGKVIPQWILRLPEEAVAAFWDGLKNSDGTRITEKSWAYDSVCKDALDLIQATAHINGFSANLSLNNPNEGPGHENHRPCWRLTISEHSTRRVETCQNRSPGAKESLAPYSGLVYCATVSTGALLVRRNGKVFVSGNCCEHPAITFNCCYFPHSVIQQARTHRISTSFDVQSMRYTGQQVLEVAAGMLDVEDVFYLRPVGHYSDRQGGSYQYTETQRQADLAWCLEAAKHYAQDIQAGHSEEHARGKLPFDYRQHFVVSFNLRSLMHFLDLRSKKDAQIEIRALCDAMWPHFEDWTPAIAAWYKTNRLNRARLAP